MDTNNDKADPTGDNVARNDDTHDEEGGVGGVAMPVPEMTEKEKLPLPQVKAKEKEKEKDKEKEKENQESETEKEEKETSSASLPISKAERNKRKKVKRKMKKKLAKEAEDAKENKNKKKRKGKWIKPFWMGQRGNVVKSQRSRVAMKGWPHWENLVQKIYILNFEDREYYNMPATEPEFVPYEDQQRGSAGRGRGGRGGRPRRRVGRGGGGRGAPPADAPSKKGKEKAAHEGDFDDEGEEDQVPQRPKGFLIRYNLVHGRIAVALPGKTRADAFLYKVKKPVDDADYPYFALLPLEVIYLIFSFLDPVVDLPRASAVSRMFNTLANDPVLWYEAITRRDIMGNTILHLAASSGEERIALRACDYFIRKGANPTIANAKGKRPEDIAKLLTHEILQMFLSLRSGTATLTEPKRRDRYYWYWNSSSSDNFYGYEALEAYREFLQLSVPHLPSPRPPKLAHTKDSPNGMWMHKYLPRSCFPVLPGVEDHHEDKFADAPEPDSARSKGVSDDKAVAESAGSAAPPLRPNVTKLLDTIGDNTNVTEFIRRLENKERAIVQDQPQQHRNIQIELTKELFTGVSAQLASALRRAAGRGRRGRPARARQQQQPAPNIADPRVFPSLSASKRGSKVGTSKNKNKNKTRATGSTST